MRNLAVMSHLTLAQRSRSSQMSFIKSPIAVYLDAYILKQTPHEESNGDAKILTSNQTFFNLKITCCK